MASWMIHFRVAQAMPEVGALGACSEPDLRAAFVMGNIAPDSGEPTPDGGYRPDKNTSHFMRRFEGVPAGENPERCDPHRFAAAWVVPALDEGNGVAAAFYLGYLCHLVTDNAWVRDFIYPAKEKFAHLRLTDGAETPEGVARFYAFLKKDWYDMDFLYLRRHPEMPAYRLFLEMPSFRNEFLPFFPVDAFERKRGEIEAFYRKGAAEVEEREVCISEEAASAFVDRVAAEIRGTFGNFFAEAAGLCEPAPL